MFWVYSTYWRDKVRIYFCWGNVREIEQLGEPGVDGKVIDLAQDSDRWWALVSMVMKLRVP
jgi:hypothetical protein